MDGITSGSFRTGRRRVFFHELGKEEEACRGNMMGAGNGEGGGGGGGKLGAAYKEKGWRMGLGWWW